MTYRPASECARLRAFVYVSGNFDRMEESVGY